jgi:hypothetical protein
VGWSAMRKVQASLRLGGLLLIALGAWVLLGTAWRTRPDLGPPVTPELTEDTGEALVPAAAESVTPVPTSAESLYPTPTPPEASATASRRDTALPAATGAAATSVDVAPSDAESPVAATRTPTAIRDDGLDPGHAVIIPAEERFRVGLAMPYEPVSTYDLASLGVGWVMNWNVQLETPWDEVVEYAQTVSVRHGVLSPNAGVLTAVAAARPGSLWLISNEPDVRWQNNVLPEIYAHLYAEAHAAIKAGDPTAIVAVGGIAQATDLRLRYLDLVLESYQRAYGEPLPADAWHIHNYILREERDSWGVDIPPGLPDDTGMLYDMDDSGNLEIFRAQIYRFRRWLYDRGYGGQPLFVTEFGVPMPAEYGFPPEVVIDFLREAWSFFLTASDPILGDPSDGGRLVQRWCWFGVSFADYPTGDLVDSTTGEWTPVGRAWMSMVER